MLIKLELYGIRGVCFNWIKDFLSQRQQCVSVNNFNSYWKKLNCGVPQGSILGPLFFLIYINELPDVCQFCKIVLFADDTNLIAGNIGFDSIQKDLFNAEKWLNANSLSLNAKKSCQISVKIGNSASNSNRLCDFKLSSVSLPESESCKYLGVHIDLKKLKFTTHIVEVKKKLSVQCGIVSKLRHYISKSVLLQYYSSNIKPIIQYGILVYGCVNYRTLEPLVLWQKKILSLILFLRYTENVVHLFEKYENLTAHELHIYKLLKFVIKSVNKMHNDTYLNDLFSCESRSTHLTRRSMKWLLKIPRYKRKHEQNSVRFRGAKLFNLLRESNILPPNFDQLSGFSFVNLVHKIRNNFILSNIQLTKTVFS